MGDWGGGGGCCCCRCCCWGGGGGARGGREGAFFQQGEDLVDFGGEEVEGGEDAAVRAEVVLGHYFFVGDRVPDVDVGVVG